MAQTFTIDSIEGNSYIGVPVFSRFGQMQNYNYIVMSPQKKIKQEESEDDSVIDVEHERFQIPPVEEDSGKKNGNHKGNEQGRAEPSSRNDSKMKSQGNLTERRKSNTQAVKSRTGANHATVDHERAVFVSQIINDLTRKVDTINGVSKDQSKADEHFSSAQRLPQKSNRMAHANTMTQQGSRS